MKNYNLVLASGSPRRKELIGWIGIPFVVVKSDVDEESDITDPHQLVADLARQKGDDVYNKLTHKDPQALPMVVSSDTMVCLGEEILGKPANRAEAKQMLEKLSGKQHEVLTSVCIQYFSQKEAKMKVHEFVESSHVEFHSILPDVLEVYLDSGDSLDKAGSYGIQGQALTFIKGLKGSYTNVMGFPLSEFVFALKEICEAEGFENWREAFV